LTWFRLPLFIWAMYATSLVMVLGTPVVAITILMAILDRCGFGIFAPTAGGDPVLFQHLFWFYSHPAVYIMILPAMGVISELVAAFSRKTIFGYAFVAMSSLAIDMLALGLDVQLGHRHARLPGLGTPHVRVRPVHLRRPDLLAPVVPGGHTLRHQGGQLDGHPLP